MGIGWDKGVTERTYGEKNLKLQPLCLKPKQCIQVKTLPPPWAREVHFQNAKNSLK